MSVYLVNYSISSPPPPIVLGDNYLFTILMHAPECKWTEPFNLIQAYLRNHTQAMFLFYLGNKLSCIDFVFPWRHHTIAAATPTSASGSFFSISIPTRQHRFEFIYFRKKKMLKKNQLCTNEAKKKKFTIYIMQI